MKKVLFVFVALLVSGARADNIITSREYVDSQANTLQSELPAKNTNTVLLNTATAGAPGERAIYDASADYAAQSDALVTAGAFNSAVQNALESEFVCIERKAQGCLLYEIRNAARQHILPTDYTQIEYLESSGAQCINTGVVLNSNDVIYEFEVKDTIPRSDASLFGSENNIDGTRLFSGILYAGSTTKRTAYLGRSANINIGYVLDDDFHSYRWVISSNKKHYLVKDGTALQTYGWTGNLNQTTPIALFCNLFYGANYAQFAIAAFKYFRIIDNGVLVFNGIPAIRNSDNKPGIYDTVSGQFLTNLRPGADFTPGPVASYLPQAQGN